MDQLKAAWGAGHGVEGRTRGREVKVGSQSPHRPSTSLRAGSYAAKGRRQGGPPHFYEREFVSILTR